MLRLTRAPFFALCNLFRHRGLVPKTEGCTVEEQVATGSSTVHPKGLVNNPKLSIETIHRHTCVGKHVLANNPLMAHMCWQGCVDACNKLLGVGNTTLHKMSWLLWTLLVFINAHREFHKHKNTVIDVT
jgi:hypothetical protein